MGLMLDMGSAPVGEIYQTPSDGRDVSWLIGHFYNGTEVKLLRFKKPLDAPEPDSPMDRIYDLEDGHVYNAKLILDILNFIKATHVVDLGISDLESHIIEWETFIGTRDELNKTDAPYMITNAELLQKDRGWIEEG